jgi:2-C-methyl-D-erythritol 4-phosphate cytidylyltransferase/2-C-methyl-D-erythritol 2,4-cyclodiphosphate synthase
MMNQTGSAPKIAAVIAAGGTGLRMGASRPKQFLPIGGKPILIRTIDALLALPGIVHVVIALPAEHIAQAESLLAGQDYPVPVQCVAGGATRQDSVHLGCMQSPEDAELLLVHDAVRPFCSPDMLQRVVDAAWRIGGAVPGLPATETIQRVSRKGRVLKTPPREELFAIQTPQCFRAPILRAALDQAVREGFQGTDESSIVRRAGHTVVVVPGSPENIKITRLLDIEIAERLLDRGGERENGTAARGEKGMLRIGYGIDYHRLVDGRKLVLGGVEIPFEKGLEGHSDADALTHAVCDALLGAAALGDIGKHFPDTDPAHRNRSSLEFLHEVKAKVVEAGWTIQNVDATLLAQRPRLSPFFENMKGNLAQALALELDAVNIKATTTEGMNAEGRGEGISAQAVALLSR